MDLPIKDKEESTRRITQLKKWLKDGIHTTTGCSSTPNLSLTNDQPFINISNTKSNDIQQSQDFVNSQQPILMNIDTFVTNRSSYEMDTTINGADNSCNDAESGLGLLTTTKSDLSKQNMTASYYYRQISEELVRNIGALEPVLNKLVISSDAGDSYLKTLQWSLHNDTNTINQEPLKKLSTIFRIASETLPLFRSITYTDDINNLIPVGQELLETSEKIITEPSDQYETELSQEIQAETNASLERSLSPKSFSLSNIFVEISKLLLEAGTYTQELKLIHLEIFEQPRQLWRKRSINCLKGKWCPAIQGQSGKQRRYIGIRWFDITDYNFDDLFVLVQLLSYDDKPHPSKVIVPPETKVKQSKSCGKKTKTNSRRRTLNDLIIKDIYVFDKVNNAILCPLTKKECISHLMNLKVIMFGLYKSTDDSDSSDEEEESPADSEEYSNIEFQLQKLCKLRICLCRRIDNDKLQNISDFVDTEWIEESKSNEPLAINSNDLLPKYLCSCGNETICVQLNTNSEKDGFTVCLNGRKLQSSEIHGVKDKQLLFHSWPNTIAGQNYLNLVISKKSALETIRRHHDPYNGLDENILLNVYLPYVEHSDSIHEHKNSSTKIAIESNEITRDEIRTC